MGDVTDCPVCYQELERPVQLNCGHTVCSDCGARLIADARGEVPPHVPGGGGMGLGGPVGADRDVRFDPDVVVLGGVGALDRDRERLERARNEQRERLAQRIRAQQQQQAWQWPFPLGHGRDEGFGAAQHPRFHMPAPAPHLFRENPGYFGLGGANGGLMEPPAADGNENGRDVMMGHDGVAQPPPPPRYHFPGIPMMDAVRERREQRLHRMGRTVIKCPECRRDMDVPDSGLPVNYKLKELIEKMRRDREVQQQAAAAQALSSKGGTGKLSNLDCEDCRNKLDNDVLFKCASCPHLDRICALCVVRNHVTKHEGNAVITELKFLTDSQIGELSQEVSKEINEAMLVSDLIVEKLRDVDKDFSPLKDSLEREVARYTLLQDQIASIDRSMTMEKASFVTSNKAKLFTDLFRKLEASVSVLRSRYQCEIHGIVKEFHEAFEKVINDEETNTRVRVKQEEQSPENPNDGDPSPPQSGDNDVEVMEIEQRTRRIMVRARQPRNLTSNADSGLPSAKRERTQEANPAGVVNNVGGSSSSTSRNIPNTPADGVTNRVHHHGAAAANPHNDVPSSSTSRSIRHNRAANLEANRFQVRRETCERLRVAMEQAATLPVNHIDVVNANNENGSSSSTASRNIPNIPADLVLNRPLSQREREENERMLEDMQRMLDDRDFGAYMVFPPGRSPQLLLEGVEVMEGDEQEPAVDEVPPAPEQDDEVVVIADNNIDVEAEDEPQVVAEVPRVNLIGADVDSNQDGDGVSNASAPMSVSSSEADASARHASVSHWLRSSVDTGDARPREADTVSQEVAVVEPRAGPSQPQQAGAEVAQGPETEESPSTSTSAPSAQKSVGRKRGSTTIRKRRGN